MQAELDLSLDEFKMSLCVKGTMARAGRTLSGIRDREECQGIVYAGR